MASRQFGAPPRGDLLIGPPSTFAAQGPGAARERSAFEEALARHLPQEPFEDLVRPSELAALLDVSLNTVYYWINKNLIPVAPGHKPWRLRRRDLDSIMSQVEFLLNTRKQRQASTEVRQDAPPAPPSDLMTAEEAAALLGVPRATVYRWLHKGHISPIIVGRRYLLRRSDVKAMLPISGSASASPGGGPEPGGAVSHFVSLKAAALGLNVTVSTVRRWVRSGKLPSRQLGSRHLIAVEQIEAMKKYIGPSMLPRRGPIGRLAVS